MTDLVDISGLNIRFTGERTVYAVNDLSLSLGHSEVLGLLGESGSSLTSLRRRQILSRRCLRLKLLRRGCLLALSRNAITRPEKSRSARRRLRVQSR